MLCLHVIIALILSSCAVGERVVNRVIDGETALTKETAREEVDIKLLPIVEAQKALSFRVNLLTKEFTRLNQHLEVFNHSFRESTMGLNDREQLYVNLFLCRR